MPEPKIETKPIEPEGPKKTFADFMQNRMFKLYYRAKFRPADANIIADNMQDAREKGIAYCRRFNLKFISVTPFFLDLLASTDTDKPETSPLPEYGKLHTP